MPSVRRQALPPERQSPTSLETLQPRFDHASHQFYVDLLLDALDDPGNRNISLAGQYGTGKSSILAGFTDQLRSKHPHLKVIQLTLSTLNPETAQRDAAAQERAAQSEETHAVTRALEKEIVRQLLYRADPSRMPASRFRRTRATEGVVIANWAIAMVATVGLIGVGLATQIPWLTLAAVAAVAVAATVWVARRGGSGLSLKQIGAAGASMHLDDSRAYFDDYLDDIIYYFQVSKARVVVFEDIDRFDNLSIFESLRELNILLNETEQLKGAQPIRFIYATRDSIFQHAAPMTKGLADDDRAGGPRSVGSSRTKFFDLVIPVIPFATRRTSRDHLTQATAGVDVDPKVIDLVAREITDMRLIRNIGNEFQVFRQKVLRDDVEVLHPTGLFAMIVYKNLYPAQFEKISTGISQLDKVHDEFRQIVNSTARRLESQPRPSALLHPEVAEATRRLHELAIVGGTPELQFNGASFPLDRWNTYDFWRAVAEAGPSVPYYLRTAQGYSIPLVTNGPHSLFAEPLTVERVDQMETQTTEDHAKRAKAQHSSIVGASMRDLIDTDIELVDAEGAIANFGTVVDEITGKDSLVSAMIKNGYIDRNFALYTSTHTDLTITPSALNFVLTSIERNRPDPRYPFKNPESDIPGVVREAGETFLTDRRALNVEIVDFLIENGRPEVETLAALIGEGTELDRDFLDAFMMFGIHKFELVRSVAAHWQDIFTFLIRDEEKPNADLVDAALQGASASVSYTTGQAVASWLDSYGETLISITDTDTLLPPTTLADVLKQLAVPVTNMAAYSSSLQAELIWRHQYAITHENLTTEIISAGRVPSLDELNTDELHQEVLARLLEDLGAYLLLCEKQDEYIVREPDNYEAMLVKIGNVPELTSQLEPDQLDALINRAPGRARVDSLDDVPAPLWPALARMNRTVVSVHNLIRYLKSTHNLDAWSTTLSDLDSIEVSAEDTGKMKTEVAVAILGTGSIPPDQRVSLVQTLGPETSIDPATLTNDSVDLIPRLVDAKLVDDSRAAFQQTRSRPAVARKYIETAKQMHTYLAQITDLSADELAAIAQGGHTESLNILLDNPALLTNLDDNAAREIAKAASAAPVEAVPYDTLTALAARCGDDCQTFVTLLTQHADQLSAPQVRGLLETMPDPYPRLGKVKLDLELWNATLLDCLERQGITAKKRKKNNEDVLTVFPANN